MLRKSHPARWRRAWTRSATGAKMAERRREGKALWPIRYSIISSLQKWGNKWASSSLSSCWYSSMVSLPNHTSKDPMHTRKTLNCRMQQLSMHSATWYVRICKMTHSTKESWNSSEQATPLSPLCRIYLFSMNQWCQSPGLTKTNAGEPMAAHLVAEICSRTLHLAHMKLQGAIAPKYIQ